MAIWIRTSVSYLIWDYFFFGSFYWNPLVNTLQLYFELLEPHNNFVIVVPSRRLWKGINSLNIFKIEMWYIIILYFSKQHCLA